MLSFSQKLSVYLGGTGARLIKIFAACAAIGGLCLLVYVVVDQVKRAQYERHTRALERDVREGNTRVQELESEIDALEQRYSANDVERQKLATRVAQAEFALQQARRHVEPLKIIYDQTRHNPDVVADASVASACAELAGVEHPCR